MTRPDKVNAEASGHLVVPPVFKTGGRRAAPSAGSIPVRLRHHRLPDPECLYPDYSVCGICDVSGNGAGSNGGVPDGLTLVGYLVRSGWLAAAAEPGW